jgi:transcriptional regulator with XRE-family HTH domain
VNSRITFGAELRYAMQVRGLSLTDVARESGVAVATASSAATGRPVNVTTALRIARAVAARPVVPELLEWVERPRSSEMGPLESGHASPQPMLASSPSLQLSTSVRGHGRRRSGLPAEDRIRLAGD